MNAKIKTIIEQIRTEEGRGDYSAKTRQLHRQLDEAGFHAGYSAARKPLYLRADSRRVRDRAAAMASY